MGQVKVRERQDLAYRDAATVVPRPTSEPVVTEPVTESAPVPVTSDEWGIEVTPTLLFRYSALTYNGHRIHCDRDVEGYPGLVTHGPLQAMVMAEHARTHGRNGDLMFSYRLLAPLFDYQEMVAGATRDGDATITWVRDFYGRQTAAGELRDA